MNTKTTKNWFWAPPKDWCRLNKIAKLYMSRRSLVRSDHVAPHSKSVQSFRGDSMHVCECCALALIIFALSFCSLCVSTSERFISWLHSNLRCESAPLHRFIHLPLLHLFACCCCYKWLTRSYLSLCLSRCCTVIFCCAPLLFFCVRSRTFRHAISGQSNCRIYLLQLHMYNNWNEHTRRRFND